MADNTTLNLGTGGDVSRSKERTGVKTVVSLLDLQDGSGGERLVNGDLPIKVAAGAEADGHSATIGATGDADTSNTIIGRLKKIVALLAGGLPAALGAQGGLKVEGVASGTAVPVSLASVPSHAVTNAGTFAVQETLSTSGGASTKNCTSGDGSTALTNSAQEIKGSAGSLKGWYIYNPNTSVAYVPVYNTAAAGVTVGTTTPLFVIAVPPGSATNVSYHGGIAFGTAISWAATSTAAGNGAPTTALEAVAFYA
jgi:hypothetical protein